MCLLSLRNRFVGIKGGVFDRIGLKQQDIFKIKRMEDKTIVCNPPYGIRLKSGVDLQAFYKSLGDFLKQRCTNSTAYIYSGERSLI